ncbi:MAG: CpsD/CapB family tyrosine-protein kinase [Gammaproteobacteria bacterium]|nr:CpsD/CapB family tyrosine-protein kinase [Gammaproteobacteria bacterium]
MERIRKALEQADIDRQKSGSAEKASHSVVIEPSESPAAAVISDNLESSQSFDAMPKPLYTRTKCIDVSDKTLRDNNVVAALPGHELQDTYRMLRTRIMKEMNANSWKMLLVTSPHQGAGKSMTAINLAVAMSMDVNSTVLLVDADLRQPSIHKYFDYIPEKGFSNYLTEDAPLEEMLFHPNGIERLVILPGKGRIEHSAEMLGSPRANYLAEELKRRYVNRFIVVDGPPVLDSDDVVITDRYVDAVLLVAEAGVTKKEELEETLRLLGNIPVLGTVLNKAPKSKARTRS